MKSILYNKIGVLSGRFILVTLVLGLIVLFNPYKTFAASYCSAQKAADTVSGVSLYTQAETNAMIPANYFMWPTSVTNCSRGITTTPHDAVDITALQNEDVVAMADGVVQRRGSCSAGGYGDSCVVIKHTIVYNSKTTILYSVYAHLNSNLVSEGQTVVKGQKIGEVGMKGNAPNFHLHFSIMSKVPAKPASGTWYEPTCKTGIAGYAKCVDPLKLTYTEFNPKIDYLDDQSKICFIAEGTNSYRATVEIRGTANSNIYAYPGATYGVTPAVKTGTVLKGSINNSGKGYIPLVTKNCGTTSNYSFKISNTLNPSVSSAYINRTYSTPACAPRIASLTLTAIPSGTNNYTIDTLLYGTPDSEIKVKRSTATAYSVKGKTNINSCNVTNVTMLNVACGNTITYMFYIIKNGVNSSIVTRTVTTPACT